tara:strand:+ start:1220 stop:1429 length:210 start_codon:yes stop_codon:yes gene_type:complete
VLGDHGIQHLNDSLPLIGLKFLNGLKPLYQPLAVQWRLALAVTGQQEIFGVRVKTLTLILLRIDLLFLK